MTNIRSLADIREAVRPFIKLFGLYDFEEAIYREYLRMYPNPTIAAEHLGVTRQTVQTRMKRYGISSEELRADRELLARQLSLKNGKSFITK